MIVLPSQAEGREMKMSFKPSVKNDSSAFVAALHKEPSANEKVKKESKKNIDSIRHVIREEDKKIDISLTSVDGPLFNHAVKRHFIKQPVTQSFDRSGKKRVEMSKEERYERAGVSTLKEEAQFHKKIFKEHPDRKDKPQGKAVVKSIPDPAVAGKISGSSSEKESRRKLFVDKSNAEQKELAFKDSRKRITSPKYKSITAPFPIRGGGMIPEDARTGIKVHSSTKPKDHGDVISYTFASMKDKEQKPIAPNKERLAYEKLITECGKQQAQENSAVYNYLRSRRSASSLALTEHLYDHKGPVQ